MQQPIKYADAPRRLTHIMRRTVLITGANAGIGFAAARQFADAGHRVVLGCRNPERGAAAVATLRQRHPEARVSALTLDMASRDSIRAAVGRLDEVDEIDVVIHNAAFFDLGMSSRMFTPEGTEVTWATNVIGPALLTELLLPRLSASRDPRVIAVTTKGLAVMPWVDVRLDDIEFERRRFTVPRAYYQSKLAHLAWMLHQAERLECSKVHFHAIRVPNVRIDLRRYPGIQWPLRLLYRVKAAFSMTPDAMASTYVWLATDVVPGQMTGIHWADSRAPAPVPRWARDAANRHVLAQRISQQLQG